MVRAVFEEELCAIVASDPRRMAALRLVSELGLPQGAVAGEFVRSAVFDRIHRHPEWTQLRAIDVVYYDPERTDPAVDANVELELIARASRRPWRVRNLAGASPGAGDLASGLDVFPDTASAVAVRLGPRDTVELAAAPYDLEDLMAGVVRPVEPGRAGELRRLVHTEKWRRRFPRIREVGLSG